MSTKFRELLDRFHKMSDQEWAGFEQALVYKEVNKNEWLTQEAQTERYLYFIELGAVRKYYLKGDKEYTIDFRFEGEFVSAYASFITQEPSRQYLQALENTQLVAISYEQMQKMYRTQVGERLGRMNAEHIFVAKSRREASLMLDSPDEKYQKLLKDKGEWFLRLPQHYIASYLGMTPETLSRVKKRAN